MLSLYSHTETLSEVPGLSGPKCGVPGISEKHFLLSTSLVALVLLSCGFFVCSPLIAISRITTSSFPPRQQNLSAVKRYPDTISSVALLSNQSQVEATDQTRQHLPEPVIRLLLPVWVHSHTPTDVS